MGYRTNQIPVLVLAACLISATFTLAQTKNPAARQPSACRANGKTQSSKAECLKLISLGPVDPAALARAMQPPGSAKTTQPNTAGPSQESAVTELHAVSGPAALPARRLSVKESKKTLLKHVHGELYGSGGAGGHAADAAVGASSKSGKVHVFVETGRNSVHQ